MAEETKGSNSNETKDQAAAGLVPVTEAPPVLKKPEVEALSAEDIEAEILKTDPLFVAGFAEFKDIKLDPAEVSIDSYDPDSELESYRRELLESRGFKKWLFRVFPFIPKFFKRGGLAKLKFKTLLLHAATVLLPQLLHFLKDQLLWILGLLKTVLGKFQAKTAAQKLGIIFFIVFVAGSSAAIWYLWVKKPLEKPDGLFVNSIEELANATYKYDPKTETEAFYGNYRVSQNILTIPRMVVNILPSVNSGPNPMAAIELYIEGGSPEVVVEIKDREAEMKDTMQRVMEEMTFDDLISPEGKQSLAEKLRKELNRVVTRGKVRRIFMKSAVFKP